MFEISLVPDVKGELIRKLKIRNLIFLICIIVSAACIGVLLILSGITAGQGASLAAQDTEMACRSDGNVKSGKCDAKFGTAVMKFENMSELMTIQDQMKNLSSLNTNKIKISRIFGILDVIFTGKKDNLAPDEDIVYINEVTADMNDGVLVFDAIGESGNNIGYRSLESFKKNVARTYFDYGNYMRTDKESGEEVEIPSFCIDEYTDERGIMYGVYHQGKPGCEAPMVEEVEEEVAPVEGESTDDEATASVDAYVDVEESDSDDETDTDGEKKEKVEKKDIYIRRTYNNVSDREEYKKGNDRFKRDENEENIKGYYFRSQCLQYDEDGNFDEDSTLDTCPLITEEPYVGNSGYGMDEESGKMLLSFNASLTLKKEIFMAQNKHILVVSPKRQNVTDSYVQVKDMFKAPLSNVDKSDGGDE